MNYPGITNEQLKTLAEQNNTLNNVYYNDRLHVYNEGKACVVERFNRTLGQMISKHVTTNKTKNYINVLQKLIDEYNNRYHSSIKMIHLKQAN